jgi:hypothetical protein
MAMTSMSDPHTGVAPPGFGGAQVRHEGRIHTGGIEKDVIFLEADPKLNDEIDAAPQQIPSARSDLRQHDDERRGASGND